VDGLNAVRDLALGKLAVLIVLLRQRASPAARGGGGGGRGAAGAELHRQPARRTRRVRLGAQGAAAGKPVLCGAIADGGAGGVARRRWTSIAARQGSLARPIAGCPGDGVIALGAGGREHEWVFGDGRSGQGGRAAARRWRRAQRVIGRIMRAALRCTVSLAESEHAGVQPVYVYDMAAAERTQVFQWRFAIMFSLVTPRCVGLRWRVWDCDDRRPGGRQTFHAPRFAHRGASRAAAGLPLMRRPSMGPISSSPIWC